MSRFKRVVTAASLIALCSCQSLSPGQRVSSEHLFVDLQLAGETTQPETAEQIFALPPQTKVQLNELLSSNQSVEQRTKAVLKLIFSYAQDGLLYDNEATKTAGETIASGKANCLSLSILTYSMAKELGMVPVFQDVKIPEYWTSMLRQTWLNGHVNVRLKQNRNLEGVAGFVLLGNDIVVDFDPYSLKQKFPEKTISQQRIVAMFHNNKAAVAYAQGNMAKAYTYYQAAAAADPDFAVTWSNLGVLYRQHGLPDLAEKSYRHSLALDPYSTNALANLAFLYRQQGDIERATPIEQKVMLKRRSNPYYHLMLGNEAFIRNEHENAISHFKKGISLDQNNHESYFGLAKSFYALNDDKLAEYYLEKAHHYALSKDDQQRYKNKLSILNQTAKAY
ncbi:tetratricopeptide repeat protein [Rheinheimera maricola]|uniref:Tetratricopeptide repeat protein n=1 Tax=Rheinheimera maricola TaxID=2793282 RepID=A0ABS7XDV3_9GAMM|nr:tetratricopeptide repeat protein [Rheinheimera maricola]MBZ9613751.1 tetratricopeptide repeat protein [Rheinheimera maricola]